MIPSTHRQAHGPLDLNKKKRPETRSFFYLEIKVLITSYPACHLHRGFPNRKDL